MRDERETESCECGTEIREWDLWPSEKRCQENGVCIGFRPEIRTGPKQKNKKKKQKVLGFRSYNTSFSVTYWLAHVAVVVFVTTLLVVLVTHFSDLLHLFLLLSHRPLSVSFFRVFLLCLFLFLFSFYFFILFYFFMQGAWQPAWTLYKSMQLGFFFTRGTWKLEFKIE